VPDKDVPDNDNRPVLAFLTSHWLSTLGSALVTIAGCSWLFVVAFHAGGRTANPYVGILLFFAIPAVFFTGLILIPIGSWLARRRIQPSRGVALRRLALFFVTMTVVNIVIASQVTYRAVSHMETDQFCGQSCHVMKPQFTANRRSVHRNVGCVECHIVPGAAGFIAAKMNGARQLMEVTLQDYPKPIPPGLQSSHLASSAETCEKCHSRAVDIGSPLRIISKFKDDEASTPIQTVLLMNGTKIHRAHLGPGVVIRYHADAKRQVISSVEYSNARTHETRTYSSASNGSTQQFVMGCADCHNRQGHAFEQPEEAVDSAMAAGRILTGVPFAHKTAVAALKTGNPPADKTLLSIYQRNVFPEFGVKWGTYPNNLGHDGCWRCHDENHATPQKKTITQDCSVCHNPLAVEEASPPILKSLGLN
jgi:hypothetical protein